MSDSADHDYFVLVLIPTFLVSVTFTRIITPSPAVFRLNSYKLETTAELSPLLPIIFSEKYEYDFFF